MSIDMQDAESLLREPDTDQQEYISNCRDPRVHLLSWSPIWDLYQKYYCNQKNIIIPIKKNPLQKEEGKKGGKEGRKEGRKEGSKEVRK